MVSRAKLDDETMDAVSKENFDLRLRVYHLEERLRSVTSAMGVSSNLEAELVEARVAAEGARKVAEERGAMLARARAAVAGLRAEAERARVEAAGAMDATGRADSATAALAEASGEAERGRNAVFRLLSRASAAADAALTVAEAGVADESVSAGLRRVRGLADRGIAATNARASNGVETVRSLVSGAELACAALTEALSAAEGAVVRGAGPEMEAAAEEAWESVRVLEGRVERLEEELRESESGREELLEELDGVRRREEVALEAKEAARRNVRELKEQLRALDEKWNETEEKKIGELERVWSERCEEWKRRADRAEENMFRLQERLANAEDAWGEVGAARASAEADNARLRAELEDEREKYQTLLEETTKEASIVQGVQDQDEGQDSELEALKRLAGRAMECSVEQVEEALRSFVGVRNWIRREGEAWSRRVESDMGHAADGVDRVQGRLELAERRLHELKDAKFDISGPLEEANQQKQRLERDLDKLSKRMSEKEAQIHSLQESNRVLSLELHEKVTALRAAAQATKAIRSLHHVHPSSSSSPLPSPRHQHQNSSHPTLPPEIEMFQSLVAQTARLQRDAITASAAAAASGQAIPNAILRSQARIARALHSMGANLEADLIHSVAPSSPPPRKKKTQDNADDDDIDQTLDALGRTLDATELRLKSP